MVPESLSPKENSGPAILGVVWTFNILDLIIVAARFYDRVFLRAGVWWDVRNTDLTEVLHVTDYFDRTGPYLWLAYVTTQVAFSKSCSVVTDRDYLSQHMLFTDGSSWLGTT